MAIRVLLGEDSYLAREGIVRVLEGLDGVDLIGSCGDLDELREAIDEARPDVVLTDIRMPPTNTDEGIRLAGELRLSHPEIGVVVFSQHAEPFYATALFEGGSARRAYLLKERLRDREELSRALQEVAAGGSVVDPRIVEELLGGAAPPQGLAARPAHAARARDPRHDRRGQEQQRDRGVTRDHEARGRAAHQLDLLEARPRRVGGREPPGQGRARLPRRIEPPGARGRALLAVGGGRPRRRGTAADSRSVPRRRNDLDVAADGAHAVAHGDEPRSGRLAGRVEAGAIVGHLERDAAAAVDERNGHADAGSSVLERIADRVGCTAVKRQLDDRRTAADAGLGDLERDRTRAAEGSNRVAETPFAEHRGVDAVCDRAKVLDRGGRVLGDFVGARRPGRLGRADRGAAQA